MKLSLIQLPTSHLGSGEKVYPLGLSRLAGLIPDNYEVYSIDMNLSLDPWMALHKLMVDVKPDVAALSFRNIDPLAGHHASYLSSLRTAALLVRKFSPDSVIIAGGPAFSLFPERLMKDIPEIDYGIKGEGEEVFASLLGNNIKPEKIPGLIWRKAGGIIMNPKGPGVTSTICLK